MTAPDDLPETGRPPRPLGPVVLGALLAAIGVVWLLAAADAIPVSAQVAVGTLLVVVGAAIALLPAGGHQALLVITGIVLAAAAAAIVSLNLHLVDTSVGERRETPSTITDVRHRYALGVGSLGIDLTRLDDEAGGADDGSIPVSATIGIGELVVAVPADAAVTVDAHIGMGEIEVRGERRSGVDVGLRTTDAGSPEEDAPSFTLRLEGGIGSIRVVDDDLGGAGGS
jgi:hypothetical protein